MEPADDRQSVFVSTVCETDLRCRVLYEVRPNQDTANDRTFECTPSGERRFLISRLNTCRTAKQGPRFVCLVQHRLILVGDSRRARSSLASQGRSQGCLSTMSRRQIQCQSAAQTARNVCQRRRSFTHAQRCDPVDHLSSSVVHGRCVSFHDCASPLQIGSGTRARQDTVYTAEYGTFCCEGSS